MAVARHVPALPDESAIDLNAAIQATEQEILSDAMGDDPFEDDGDTSLEEMDEHADGEDTDEGDRQAEEERRAAAEGEGEGGEEGEAQGQGEAEGEQRGADQQTPQVEPDARGRVPAHRLREETERRRQVEQERDHLARTREAERAEINELHQRFDSLLATLAARGPAQPQAGAQPGATTQPAAEAAPDMFADPQGYQRWVDRRIEERAREIATTTVNATFQQNQVERVNQSLEAAARGPRGWEFQPAYTALTSLNPRDPANQRLVHGIFNAHDPAAALWDWWEANGGGEYRQQIFEQLAPNFQQNPRGNGNGNGRVNPQNGGGQQRPRVEFRPPVTASRNPPSLNSMAGHGGGQRGVDPRSLDGSDRATFNYAFDDNV